MLVDDLNDLARPLVLRPLGSCAIIRAWQRSGSATRAAINGWYGPGAARCSRMCLKSREDPDFPKYPRVPVQACAGYEKRRAAGALAGCVASAARRASISLGLSR